MCKISVYFADLQFEFFNMNLLPDMASIYGMILTTFLASLLQFTSWKVILSAGLAEGSTIASTTIEATTTNMSTTMTTITTNMTNITTTMEPLATTNVTMNGTTEFTSETSQTPSKYFDQKKLQEERLLMMAAVIGVKTCVTAQIPSSTMTKKNIRYSRWQLSYCLKGH